MTTKTKYRSLSISLPEEVVKRVDKEAKRRYQSRSDVIRESILINLMPTYTPTKAENKALDEARNAYHAGEFIKLEDLENEFK